MDAPILDAHQHFWHLARGDYDWLTSTETALYRDFHPDDLRPALKSAGVTRTIAVQAAATVAETRWLLDLAASTDFIAGVVGWVDLTMPDVSATLQSLQSSPYLVGVRPMLQDLSDPRWILKRRVQQNLAYCAEAGLRVDWLVTPRELPWAAEAAQRLPDLYHIVDHLGKPSAMTAEWTEAMSALAAHPHGYCKVSGLSTLPPSPSPPDAPWKVEAVAQVWKWFGPDRLVFGSDWPVCLSGGISYQDAVHAVRSIIPSNHPDHLTGIFGKNAETFYRIDGQRHLE